MSTHKKIHREDPDSTEDGKKKKNDPLENHYLAITTSIGILVAALDAVILHLMNSDSINNGIGIAMVGIVTFFGMMIASSVFEEHRRKSDNPKKNESQSHSDVSNPKKNESQSHNGANLLEKTAVTVISGKGIMRKAIASSLILVYIIILGLYLENGELNEPFPGIETPAHSEQESAETSSTGYSNSGLAGSITIATPQLIQDNDVGESGSEPHDGGKETETPTKEGETTDNAKPIPRSLLEHFTTVITAMIVFYFASSTVEAWFKSKYGSGNHESAKTGKGKETDSTKKVEELGKKVDKIMKQLNIE